MNRRRFVALDRDGTIVVERYHLSDPRQLELIPDAPSGLRQMSGLGLGLIVTTNQSVVSRGYLDTAGLEAIHQRLRDLLTIEQVSLDGIYYCPHTHQDDCFCRKPKPGLLHLAANELGFDLGNCFVIGDKASDIEAGQRVGATTLLVRSGYGEQVAKGGTANPDHVVAGLSEAAQVIQRILTKENSSVKDDIST